MPPVHCAISRPAAYCEVIVLVDVGAERRALDVGVDLVRDRNQAVAEHFQRDRIDGEGAGVFLHG
jgi:hypothetical protein